MIFLLFLFRLVLGERRFSNEWKSLKVRMRVQKEIYVTCRLVVKSMWNTYSVYFSSAESATISLALHSVSHAFKGSWSGTKFMDTVVFTK